MITKGQILEIVQEKMTEGLFLISVSVGTGNHITVIIDGDNGVSIDDCVRISRSVEGSFDREVEDFSLDVFSAGLGQPFQVKRQYTKNLGKEIEIVTKTGEHYEGILKSVDEIKITLEYSLREKVEGKNKKELVTKNVELNFDQIKTAKNIISFK
ncbi:MAG: ribosome assembly cofactor RimP [Bacteroidota bacterium]|nr:ribosome assembly cofactor RimP [Bacteroidota bacterium]